METAVSAPTAARLGKRAVRATGTERFAGHARPPCVLVVDDDPGIRLLCSLSLQLEGLLVLEAANGEIGLEQARAERPDLILTDVKMPGLDGFQLAEALRGDERTSEVPLIFLSGETAAANEARARELGALAYLTKPFDPAALCSLIAGLLARAEESKQAAKLVPTE